MKEAYGKKNSPELSTRRTNKIDEVVEPRGIFTFQRACWIYSNNWYTYNTFGSTIVLVFIQYPLFISKKLVTTDRHSTCISNHVNSIVVFYFIFIFSGYIVVLEVTCLKVLSSLFYNVIIRFFNFNYYRLSRIDIDHINIHLDHSNISILLYTSVYHSLHKHLYIFNSWITSFEYI